MKNYELSIYLSKKVLQVLEHDMYSFTNETKLPTFIRKIVERQIDNHFQNKYLWKDILNDLYEENNEKIDVDSKLSEFMITTGSNSMTEFVNRESSRLIGVEILNKSRELDTGKELCRVKITTTKFVDKAKNFLHMDQLENTAESMGIIVLEVLKDYLMYNNPFVRERLFFHNELDLLKSIFNNPNCGFRFINKLSNSHISYMIPYGVNNHNKIDCVYCSPLHKSWSRENINLKVIDFDKINETYIISTDKTSKIISKVSCFPKPTFSIEPNFSCLKNSKANNYDNSSFWKDSNYFVKVSYLELGEQGYIVKGSSLRNVVELLNEKDEYLELRVERFKRYSSDVFYYADKYKKCWITNLDNMSESTNITDVYYFDYQCDNI